MADIVGGAPIVLKIDTRKLGDMGKAFHALSDATKTRIIYRALNRGGDRAFTAIKRVIRDETGIPAARVAATMTRRKAFAARLTYEIDAKGRYLAVTVGNFGARQVRQGVSHRAWNRRQTAKGAFMHGRVALVRKTSARYPLKTVWGPAVPREMIRGKSGDALRASAEAHFMPEAMRQIEREIVAVKGRFGL